jgi:hypothetical protein
MDLLELWNAVQTLVQIAFTVWAVCQGLYQLAKFLFGFDLVRVPVPESPIDPNEVFALNSSDLDSDISKAVNKVILRHWDPDSQCSMMSTSTLAKAIAKEMNVPLNYVYAKDLLDKVVPAFKAIGWVVMRREYQYAGQNRPNKDDDPLFLFTPKDRAKE